LTFSKNMLSFQKKLFVVFVMTDTPAPEEDSASVSLLSEEEKKVSARKKKMGEDISAFAKEIRKPKKREGAAALPPPPDATDTQTPSFKPVPAEGSEEMFNLMKVFSQIKNSLDRAELCRIIRESLTESVDVGADFVDLAKSKIKENALLMREIGGIVIEDPDGKKIELIDHLLSLVVAVNERQEIAPEVLFDDRGMEYNILLFEELSEVKELFTTSDSVSFWDDSRLQGAIAKFATKALKEKEVIDGFLKIRKEYFDSNAPKDVQEMFKEGAFAGIITIVFALCPLLLILSQLHKEVSGDAKNKLFDIVDTVSGGVLTTAFEWGTKRVREADEKKGAEAAKNLETLEGNEDTVAGASLFGRVKLRNEKVRGYLAQRRRFRRTSGRCGVIRPRSSRALVYNDEHHLHKLQTTRERGNPKSKVGSSHVVGVI
jgi:hypothetical protein